MSLETGDQLIFRHGDKGEHLHRVVEKTGAESRPPDQGVTYRLWIEDVLEPEDGPAVEAAFHALEDLQYLAYTNALNHSQFDIGLTHEEREAHFPKYLANIMSELGEAQEDWRHDKPVNVLDFDGDGKPVGIPSELADVIIWTLSTSGYYGIDLAEAVRRKMAHNRTRPVRHGKGRI